MYRLIYKSRGHQDIDWDLVHDLVGKSERKNEESGITGVLLATKSHFLQVLEGEFGDVNRLFHRIARDPRHDEVQIVSFACVDSRLFGGWSMHAIGLFDFNQELVSELIDQYGEEEGNVRFPTVEWNVLALIADLRRG